MPESNLPAIVDRVNAVDTIEAIFRVAEAVETMAAEAVTKDQIEDLLSAVAAIETKAKLRRVQHLSGRLSATEIELRRKLAAFYPEQERGRGKTSAAPDVLPPQRRADLRQLAAVPDAIVEAAQERARETGERISEKALIREARKSEPPKTPPAPDTSSGLYSVVLADPPWRYDFAQADSRAIENQYATLTVDQIGALPVGDLFADDAILFLWGTSPKLREALAVMELWGFEYVTCGVWVKDKIGMGYYFRQRHELLLVGRRGKIAAPAPADRPDSVISAPRDEHSRKPAVVHQLIDGMYPGHRKIELFARRAAEGWDAWGNE